VRRLLAAGAAVVLLLTGCTGDDEAPLGDEQPSRVDVDTPELRALKAEIGVEDCVPGTGASDDLPDLTLACLGGGPAVDLATLQGPMIVNFWYAACGPCRAEMPAIQDFHEQYGDRVPVVGVTKDIYPEAAFELMRSTGARYPQLADPGDDVPTTALRPRGYPAFAFIAEDGSFELTAGGIESAEELADLVEDHLGITL
jgi:thiol-disulfide isomerase/thioredoxin